MISIEPNTQKIYQLSQKMQRYPEFAIKRGLENVSDYLNTPEVKNGIYPLSKSGQSFIWSSDKQRRAFFASNGFGGGIPTVRTMNLANMGIFKVSVNLGQLFIYYENLASYAKWVIGRYTQIIGHSARGWRTVNRVIKYSYRQPVLSKFRESVVKAWREMDAFITGGGSGL